MKTTASYLPARWACLAAAVIVALVSAPPTQAQTGLKSSSATNSKSKAAPEGSISRLPAAVMRDERVSGAVETVKSRVEEELDGRSTEDVLRAAQQRIAASKGGGGTTITDVNRSGGTTTAAPTATARPVAAASAPVAVASTTPSPAPAVGTPSAVPVNPGAIPAPVPLRSKYEKEKKTNEQAMEIEADESVMDNNQRLVTFTGNVVVNHPGFKLTSDHLEVYLHEETTIEGGQAIAPSSADGAEDKPPFKRAIATGSMVEIEKIGADGKTQIAKSRKADYDAKTGDIVLTGGPPTLQSGTGYVNSTSPDAVIILRGNGKYELPNESGNGGRHKLQIPIKGGAGASASGGGIPAGNLESITNRNKDR